MIPRILSIVVDEAHAISHWGSGFRKKYGSLGIFRALVPKGTPFVAMSATLSDRVRKDVLSKLQFKMGTFLDLAIGNDRPNVSLVVRAIQNPMNAFSDLDFLIPRGVTNPEQIKQAFIYADQINSADGMEKRLYSIAPESFREAGIIRPYSAAYSVKYRTEVMALFRAGIVHILICTDAAGMVCQLSVNAF
jgi:superfamily II DNA helicase RecQ